MNETSPRLVANRWTRIDGIDCLRALAIYLVLMNHVNMRLMGARIHYLRGVPPQLAWSLVWNGQQGVQIFFAVSGFLITATSMRRWGTLSRLNIREFYLLRFARIAPLLFALLAVLTLLHLLHVNDFVVDKKVGGLQSALIAALTLRVGLLEATKGYLPGNWDILWSLSVEEMFYLGFPLLCRFLGRGRWLVGVLAIFVVMGPFSRTILSHGNETWQEYSYLGGMDAIALGCLTALLVVRRSFSRVTLLAWTGAGFALLIFCLGFSIEVSRLGLNHVGLGMTIVAVGTCLLIASAAKSQWSAPVFFAPVLAYGRRSYEIYLTHMFVVFTVFDLFMTRTNHSLWLVPVLFAVVILLAGLLGDLVGRFYSEPANRWIRTRFGNEAAKSKGTILADSLANG
jgi:peptidoglycan/LPS O-acetylase OafA/YrhL